MKSTNSCAFYEKLDGLFSQIGKFLNSYGKSEVLQKHMIKMFNAFFYATLINNFFGNLNSNNIRELKLPKGKIKAIRNVYKDERRCVNNTLSCRESSIDVDYYINFKSCVQRDFPGFERIFRELEKLIDYDKAQAYLKQKEEAIKNYGKEGLEWSAIDFPITMILEAYAQKKKSLPIGKNLEKLTKKGLDLFVSEFCKLLKKNLDKGSTGMLAFQRKLTSDYENQLYETWKRPIDLLECLIRVSLESGQKQANKLEMMPDSKDNFKYAALLKIHSRALHISNEILVLLKSGYPDGANSRWRSLHELAVISLFLYGNDSNVSKRYLDHHIIRRFKEVTDYQAACRKLGYQPLPRKEVNRIKKEKERLCILYNDGFHKDYGWIPSSLLHDRSFRSLEEKVRLSKLHPFYNLSCDAVHGGPKGFYRLGLIAEQQEKVMLIGPSDYGLADPMQNTAISLAQVSAALLGLIRDFENVISMNVINMYTKEIGKEAAYVQEQMEKNHALNKINS